MALLLALTTNTASKAPRQTWLVPADRRPALPANSLAVAARLERSIPPAVVLAQLAGFESGICEVSMAYAIINDGTVVNAVTATPDYAASQGWISLPEGFGIGDFHDGVGFIKAPSPPSPVPQSVTRAQGKAALIQTGLYAGVVGYIESISDPTERALAEVALNDTLEWSRSSPFLNAAAAAIGLSDTAMDDLFRLAASIQL